MADAQTLPAPWATRDIGSPALAGTASVASGTYTVTGAGADIWGTSDQFRFVYQPLQGDVDVIARVASLQQQDVWSKAGVMIRADLTAGSPHAFMLVSAARDYGFQHRAAAGGSTGHTAGPVGSAPGWVRMVRRGSQFTAYYATDGGTWTTVGSQSITMGSTVYVGLAVTSHNPSATSTATFTNVAVSSAGTLPAPWTNRDVGSPALAGKAGVSNGVFSVTGAGADIWGTSDQFHYVYQPIQGDAEIVARVASFSAPDGWSKAGLMIRAALTGSSQNVLIAATQSEGWMFTRRLSAGAETISNKPRQPGTVPGWIRLVREGSLFSGYYSSDGSSWLLLGSETIAMPTTVYVGLAVTSHNTGSAATATYSNVTIRQPSGGGNQAPTVSISSPASGATYSAPASITIAAAASDSDGTVSRVDFYRGSTLIGSDTGSPFSVTWSSVPAGSYSLTAVATDNGGATATSAAVAITVGTSTSTSTALPAPWTNRDVGSPALAGRASVSNGVFSVTGAGADIWGTSDQFHYVYQPFQGDAEIVARVASFSAPDGWSKAGLMIRAALTGSSQNVLVAATKSEGWMYTRRITSGDITYSNKPRLPGAAPGWLRLVRQGNLFSGYYSSDGSSWTLMGSDTIVMPTTVYVGLAVTSHNTGTTATSTYSNVTVRQPSGGNQAPTVSISSPVNGTIYSAPASITIAAAASDSDGTVSRVDFYQGSTLIGSDTSSPFSVTWSSVPAGSYSLTAVATDNGGATARSAAVLISVGSSTVPATTLAFTPSADHATKVTSYSVALRRATDSVTATPVATRDLGKPSVVNNEIRVDISTLVNPLPSGAYYAVVTAIGSGGSASSTPSASFTK